MTDARFDDELLSTILDGAADEQTVAAVHADPVASQRLEHLRTAVDIVAEEPAPASPERRAASIAAAMAAATPASPEVTSLSAARHERTEAARSFPTWLAVAAAIALVVLAIPVIAALRPDGSESVADTATDSSQSLSADDAADDATDDAADDAADTATADLDAAVAEAASGDMAEQDAGADSADDAMDDAAEDAADAMDDTGDSSDSADAVTGLDSDSADGSPDAANDVIDPETLARRLPDIAVVNDVAGITDMISIGAVTAELTTDDLLSLGVNGQCLDGANASPRYGVALLSPDGTNGQLVIVDFEASEDPVFFDAEDCGLLG